MLSVSIQIALIVLFIHSTMQEGMIFGKVQQLLWNVPYWIKKPLFECVTCMTPWWGLIIFFIARKIGFIEFNHYKNIIFPLLIASGFNYLISSLIYQDHEGNSN